MINVIEMVGDEGVSSKCEAWGSKCEQGEEMDDEDQIKRWQELLKQGSDDYCLEGVDLLKAMDMDAGDLEMVSNGEECHKEQSELDREIANQINKARELSTRMGFVRTKRSQRKGKLGVQFLLKDRGGHKTKERL
jgi:hypothetical protein